MLRIAIAALALFAFGSLARADCTDPANQAELTECAGKTADKADADLNAAYTKLAAMLGAGDRDLLVKAQEAWIAFRDAECAFRADAYRDGSIYSTLVSNCRVELSTARTTQLNDQVNCGEGDLCPPHIASAAESPAASDAARTCLVTAGMKRAQLYASQCTAVTAEANPHCSTDVACGVMIDDIRAGCTRLGGGGPPFCATYRGEERPNP
jgi:uncharacterized protein YecT (DUF1311 family)